MQTALRIAEFDLAQKEAEVLRASSADDPEALSLYGDALWSAGLFDEAERVYRRALAIRNGVVTRALRHCAVAGHAEPSWRKR